MRAWKTIAVALLALSVAACGAQQGDRDDVEEGLEGLGPEWDVRWVELNNSNSEGMANEVSVGLDHKGKVGAPELAEALAAATGSVSRTRGWSLSISIRADGELVDLTDACETLAPNRGLGPFCDSGKPRGSVTHVREIVAEYQG